MPKAKAKYLGGIRRIVSKDSNGHPQFGLTFMLSEYGGKLSVRQKSDNWSDKAGNALTIGHSGEFLTGDYSTALQYMADRLEAARTSTEPTASVESRVATFRANLQAAGVAGEMLATAAKNFEATLRKPQHAVPPPSIVGDSVGQWEVFDGAPWGAASDETE